MTRESLESVLSFEKPMSFFNDLCTMVSNIVGRYHVDELSDRLGQHDRLYHDIWHIGSMYAFYVWLLEEKVLDHDKLICETYSQFEAVICAIMYHDIVYVAGDGNNETNSLALWVKHSSGLPDVFCATVGSLILGTVDHFSPQDPASLGACFCSLDLMPLALPYKDFVLNNQLIRLEFGEATNKQYAKGRNAFLKARVGKQIYACPAIGQFLEERAQENITKYLAV